MKTLVLFLVALGFFSTAQASQLSCEDAIMFDSIEEFGSLANGPSLRKPLVTVAQSKDTILFEGTLMSTDMVLGVPEESQVYITATKVGATCTDIKYLYPAVAQTQ